MPRATPVPPARISATEATVSERPTPEAPGGSFLLRTLTGSRYRLFLLFLICESLAFLVIPASTALADSDLAWQIHACITALMLAIALLLRRTEAGRPYSPVFYAFFVGAVAVLISILLGAPARQLLGYDLNSASGIATAKLSQSMLRVLPLLILIGLAGGSRYSLYLNRGRLAVGLAVGVIAFLAFAAAAYAPWVGDAVVRQKLLRLTPWVLLFIFANAIEEELLFRGLFLKRFEPFLGKLGANLVTAVAFTFIHTQVTYAADMVQFIVILFLLALAFGHLMQRSSSLWGSVIFHAGADLLLIVSAYATL